jgi:predicted enzyme related to lactoylglutathione lyase
MEGMAGYYLFRSGEGAGGAIGKRGQTAPPALRLYITVDSLEEATAAAEANGGSVVERPTEIGQGMGRFAVVRDPEGTEVGLWENAPGA